ncbi:MAG: ABC transporter substrate-binding protein [Microthrixaceae bacterium]|nr:ABC transporter substrate-binding protein [Microthrixaceae bacterium]
MRTRKWWLALVGIVASFTLVAAACSDDGDGDDASDDTTDETTPSGDDVALSGMKGTTPLVDLSDEFKDRMLEIDPALVDFNYGPESYDAVIIMALAAEQAGTDGAEFANYINGITRDGEKCTDYAGCLELVQAGTDIDYDGASGPLEFSGNGEPTEASYGILEFGNTGCDGTKECIDNDKTTFVTATAPSEADVPQEDTNATREGDGEFVVGSLLPETGSLAFLGPPEFAGVNLAIQEINEAGGVLGKDARHIQGDSGDTENNVAPGTVDTLLSQNVDAIVGAASSSVSLSVIDKIINAGVVMFSPANTSKKFSTYDDNGLYFRDAPSDILQGQVLADTIIGDGHSNVYALVLNDDYGTGLLEDLTNGLEGGGATMVGDSVYDPKAADFSAEVEDAKGADPDAIVIIGFDETSRILTTMIEQGIGPQDLAVYGVDGNMGNALAENFEAGA